MSLEETESSKSEAAAMLAAAHNTATASAEQSEPPRYFVVLASMVCAVNFSMFGVVDQVLWYWLLLLFVPLGFWFFVERRKRPKSRIPLRHSGKYMLAVLGLMLAAQISQFWIPEGPALVAAKFAALLAVFWVTLSIMRRESITNRIHDGQERSA